MKNIARERSPAPKCDACQSNQSFWNFVSDPAEVVAGAAARTLPSTRAGGQDVGSLNKLSQNIVKLNLCVS